MVQSTVKGPREVSVGEAGDERDARVQQLAAVKRDAPLPDQDRTRGNEPAREREEGYTEDATWDVLLEAVREAAFFGLWLRRSPGPPEQNAEAVMPTVWAMRIAAGRGAIAKKM